MTTVTIFERTPSADQRPVFQVLEWLSTKTGILSNLVLYERLCLIDGVITTTTADQLATVAQQQNAKTYSIVSTHNGNGWHVQHAFTTVFDNEKQSFFAQDERLRAIIDDDNIALEFKLVAPWEG